MAYGVTDWFEQGLYCLSTVMRAIGEYLNGWKLRELFAVPHAEDRVFVYAVNFEFSFNSKHWIQKNTRQKSGLSLACIWVSGFLRQSNSRSRIRVKNLDFAPSARIAYNISKPGRGRRAIRRFWSGQPVRARTRSSQQMFAVVDYSGEPLMSKPASGWSHQRVDHMV